MPIVCSPFLLTAALPLMIGYSGDIACTKVYSCTDAPTGATCELT